MKIVLHLPKTQTFIFNVIILLMIAGGDNARTLIPKDHTQAFTDIAKANGWNQITITTLEAVHGLKRGLDGEGRRTE